MLVSHSKERSPLVRLEGERLSSVSLPKFTGAELIGSRPAILTVLIEINSIYRFGESPVSAHRVWTLNLTKGFA